MEWTMEKITEEKNRLAVIENDVRKLERINNLIRMLSDEHFVMGMVDATTTMLGTPHLISTLLTDREHRVMADGVRIVLEFAKQRIEKELESK